MFKVGDKALNIGNMKTGVIKNGPYFQITGEIGWTIEYSSGESQIVSENLIRLSDYDRSRIRYGPAITITGDTADADLSAFKRGWRDV